MCMGSTKAPKIAPPAAPLRNVDASMDAASSDAARQQAMRKGLASVWTRYNTAANPAAGASDKLGA